jgi:hypothetical protein
MTTTATYFRTEFTTDDGRASAAAELARLESDLDLARHQARAEVDGDQARALDISAEAATLVGHALRALHRARLDYQGVTCPSCRGMGDRVTGFSASSFTTPSEAEFATCDLCRGDGEVLLPEVDAWLARLSDADREAVDEWLYDTAHPSTYQGAR